MKYEECVKHKVNMPDHTKSILTSKEFASETKFITTARAMNKVIIEEGKEIYENPYKSKDRRGRPSTQMLLYKEELILLKYNTTKIHFILKHQNL
jgi:hypothetical protein